MKKSYDSYINKLTGTDLVNLDHIISKKYKQFKKFYISIANFSNNVQDVSYLFTDDTNLKIEIIFDNEALISDFIDILDGYHIHVIECRDNRVYIEVQKE